MKKNFIIAMFVCVLTVNYALADGMVFDPTEYSSTPAKTSIVTTNTTNTTYTTKTTPTKSATVKKTPANPNIQAESNLAQDAISKQSGSFNNALYELDTAQVNLRNDLLEYKSKYQEIDTQYSLIKEQRRVLKKQIGEIEKRITSIEKSKNRIRKTMI